MKIGQSASYLDFAIPEEARAALASLCTRSRPMAPSVVAEIFIRELGASPRRLFAEWSPEPFAAASIGQVHRARLKSGELVAVKVQYPRIVEAIDADLKNSLLAERAIALIFRGGEPGVFSGELRERFLEECDYRHEAANQQELRRLWAGRDEVLIPRVFEELTTTRILVTELASGDDFETFAGRASQAEKDRAGDIMYRFAYESIFRHGLFNADPNPGNYLFHERGVTSTRRSRRTRHPRRRHAMLDDDRRSRRCVTAELARAGAEAGLRSTSVSSDGNQATHDRLRGLSGAYRSALAASPARRGVRAWPHGLVRCSRP